MSTAFDKIGSDRQLQDHWIRRLIAGIIDSIIISIIASIIVSLITFPTIIVIWPLSSRLEFQFFWGMVFFIYALLLESYFGATLGKQIMNLKVTTDGRMASLDRTLIRDISKIHGLLWLIDTLLGMATAGDPHQKYSDRFAGTSVASTLPTGLILPSPPSPPAPPTPPSSG